MIAALLSVALLGACTPADDSIPQDSGTTSHQAPKSLKKKISSCDQAREAFLTGSAKDQRAALRRLQADRKADGTAREYAKYWLTRDKSDPDMREADESIISTACAI